MDKIFPPEIKTLVSNRNVKEAFISVIEPVSPKDCQNCGGAEVFALFLATDGPYQSPGAPYRGDGKTSHWDETIKKWWVGNTYTFPCPVCIREGRVSSKPVPAQSWVQNDLKQAAEGKRVK